MRGNWSRLAPLTGLVFAGLLIAAFVVGGSTPNSDASAARVVSFFEAHRNAQFASAFLVAYSVIFGLFFGGALRSYLRARSSSDGLIAVGFAGLIVFGVGAASLASLSFAATDVPGKIAPAAEQALNVLSNDVFFALLLGMGVFLFGNGLAIVRSKALPAWLGWVAIAFGVVAVTPIGWFALFGVMGWTLVVSILMFVREGRPPAAV
jgi:hypothetical protein